MRVACLSIFLSLLFITSALAFQVESRTDFPARGEPDITLDIISTTDTEVFEPLILEFQNENPGIRVIYTTVTTPELMTAIATEQAPYDLAISSAMDLQTKLANDGLTRTHVSTVTRRLPDWARWRDQVFAFTQEPAAIVISPSAFKGLEKPRTRQALLALLRDHGNRFEGRIGTYDLRESGLGYLFATQDARTSETFWRLSEVMGRLEVKLYCCSGDMIRDVNTGKLAIAYNVLGSYAQARLASGDDIEIILPDDFTTMMLRTAVIPVNANAPLVAGEFVDFLISQSFAATEGAPYPFPPIDGDALERTPALRPIELGPGLLVYLDQLKRQRFLEAWQSAIEQQ